jgi:outer membrane lipoprotein SlyB
MNTRTILAGFLLLLGGCATTPSGPGVLVLPGSGKSFDQFRFDDQECRQFAHSSVGGSTPGEIGVDAGVKSAVVGTAVGAAAGAAIGGNSGAGTGAGLGLVTGALAGAGAAQASSHTLQQRYDNGYQQCMYAKGNKVPMAAQSAPRERPYRGSSYGYAPYPPPPPRY